MTNISDEIANCWDQKAKQWRSWVGENGDSNRIFNSDPVLWRMAGDLKAAVVLDAGCGTGYLSLQLAETAKQVIGVDISENMIREARGAAVAGCRAPEFRVDSCMSLATVDTNSVDVVVSNYVLMDLPDLDGAVASFYRVLKSGGRAICVIGHPFSSELKNEENYFDEVKKVDRWGPFDSDFIFFHRPLSRYWRSFRAAGFKVEDFDEPVAQDTSIPGFKESWKATYRRKPWSVAFHLVKN